ncbi:MAG: efflux RND transporter periplasmic adaptor subunit [Akkermansia sp.]
MKILFCLSLLSLLCYGARAEEAAHEEHAGHEHAEHAEHAESEEHVDHEEHEYGDHDHEEHDACGGGHEHAEHDDHDHDAHETCDGGHEHAEHGHDAHETCGGDHAKTHDHGAPVELKVDEKARAILRMQIEVVPPSSRPLTGSVYGRLTAPNHEMESYSLPVAGRIALRVKSAQQVEAGQVLFALQSPAVAEQMMSLESLRSNRERCAADAAAMAERVGRLHAAGARNGDLEEQLRFKQSELAQAEKDVQAAETRLRLLCMGAELVQEEGLPTLLVRATAAGTVRNVGVTQGSWGEQGAAVLTLSHPRSLEIEAAVYGSDVPEVEEIRALVPDGREMRAVSGSWRLSEQLNPETQTRSLYFTPDALPATARAGQLCRLDLYGSAAGGSIVCIPDSAVVRVGTDDVVFVEAREGLYYMYKVHAGASRRGMTPVDGLQPGMRIVVKGGYELKYCLPTDGTPKKAAGHFHADGKFHEGEH